MKNFLFLCILGLAALAVCSIHSCKKDTLGNLVNPPPPITPSYTEEFEDFSTLKAKGWLVGEYSEFDTLGITSWTQGDFGPLPKGDTTWYGFTAYSYALSPDEYAYSYTSAIYSNLSISSWLLTPVLSVKNGDKISFYTRGDTTGIYTDRMQVLLNKLASTYIGHDLNSVGDFTTILYDVNASQAPGGYPTSWTKYEYTFSGISGKINIRIAFRHFVINPINARGVGIDVFKFEVN